VLQGFYQTLQFPEPNAGFDVDRIAQAILRDADDRAKARERNQMVAQRVRETQVIADRVNGERVSKVANVECSPEGNLILHCHQPLDEQQARQILHAIALVVGR
jgi:hypothetical protein